jgi:predicted peptidase
MQKYLALVCVLLLSACAHKPTINSAASGEQLQRLDYLSSVDQQSHQYFVYLPRGYADQPQKKWPLMLFLHGNGERGNGRDELDYVLSHGPLYEAWIQKKDLPFIIISPQLPMFGMEKVPYIAARTRAQIPLRLATGVPPRNARFATPAPMGAGEEVKDMSKVAPLLPMGWEQVEQDLLGMIARVQADYRTDSQRLYLTGLSYGGFGTWYMASKHPQLFAAIAPVVGWGHPDLMAPIAQAKLPVWAFAGGRDTSVEKKYFYAGINKLEQLGAGELRFTVEEDMGHDTWTRVYSGDDLYSWLLQHTKAQ